MPDSRHKYLYERLGDHDFQQLVAALLTLRFPGFVPLPLRQADGGRDGVDPSKLLIYQVKWSQTGQERDPVDWLDTEIRRESDKIKRFSAEGTKRYVLVTNVPSTGRKDTGRFDRLNAKLDDYGQDFGLEMSCIWREALNPMVDSAPSETKWAYADMLAGWDLIRYLVDEQADQAKARGLRDLLRKVASVQWDDDERIKFSQVELDRERLVDLFVDVPATRIAEPGRVAQRTTGSIEVGGAAAYITTKSPYPFTLIRGAPGQGKSTLGQFVCQSFRAAFVPGRSPREAELPAIKDPRFPIRFDLGDYAAWIQGYDVFDESHTADVKKGRHRPAAKATVEAFLAELMSHASAREVTPAEVQDLFERVPSLVVLDGLDEVGSIPDRKRVVREIDLFCARGRSYVVEPRVIVTTRPNSAGLLEPNPDIFETISLSPLDAALRAEYLRRWCEVHNVRGNDSRTLRRNFTEKTREPYIGELAGNPMQLSILLYLLRQHGDATPNQRTELYDAYMNLLLLREANKHPESVRKYRADLSEIVPFLGWYVQSRAEESGHSGRMAYDALEAAMKHFQRTYGKREDVVDELFTGVTDRLWALTGKEEGTFEFEVLSLREYFAGHYLYHYAGEGDPHFDRTVVLRELLKRPYWLNTARFYAANAKGTDIYALEAGIKHELQDNASQQVRVAAWTLTTDGVFSSRPHEAASVVDALTDDLGTRLLLAAFDSKDITPLPEANHASRAWDRLTTAIASAPDNPLNRDRVRVLRELCGLRHEFAVWWLQRLQESITTATELAWLRIGAACEVAAEETFTAPATLAIKDGEYAQLILNTGLLVDDDDTLGTQLLRAVLDGQCSETTSVRSVPAQTAAALSPAEFFGFGSDASDYRPSACSADRRSQAMQHLRRSDSPLYDIARLRRFRKGEKGSTFPWANTAAGLLEVEGRCWLVSEIAVIGAASPNADGYTLAPGTEALGTDSHPATLIAQTRRYRADQKWWSERRTACRDDLSQAEWALAVWAIASTQVVEAMSDELDQTVNQVPSRLQRALRIAAQRLTESGWVNRRWVGASSDAAETIGESAAAPAGRAVGPAPSPLAAVARREKWLKVDQAATYH